MLDDMAHCDSVVKVLPVDIMTYSGDRLDSVADEMIQEQPK